MNIKKLFNLSLVLILGFILSGCANSQFAKKYNKPFKHNTPLIKKDMRSIGKAEIAKTLEMGPKPVEGDKVIERKRKIICLLQFLSAKRCSIERFKLKYKYISPRNINGKASKS